MTNLAGVWAAVVTPLDEADAPNAALALGYYRDLLQRGCHGVNVLGTTGEAMSFGAAQRMRFMEAVAESGLPTHTLMVGTGAAAPADAARLTRCAFECDFAAALVMPPFFFRDATDDGIVAFFDAVFAKTDPPRRRVLLYNFPRMSGIAFHPDLVTRLLAEFPGVIAGMKDSSNDATLQSELRSRHPELVLFPGSESDLLSAKARGVSGCISGSVALWPGLARRAFDDGDEWLAATLTQARAVLDGFAFIPAVRYLIAKERNDASWARPLTPLRALSREQGTALAAAAAPFLATGANRP